MMIQQTRFSVASVTRLGHDGIAASGLFLLTSAASRGAMILGSHRSGGCLHGFPRLSIRGNWQQTSEAEAGTIPQHTSSRLPTCISQCLVRELRFSELLDDRLAVRRSPLPLHLRQQPEDNRPKSLVLLQVDQEFGQSDMSAPTVVGFS